jgi:hypothetical protein
MSSGISGWTNTWWLPLTLRNSNPRAHDPVALICDPYHGTQIEFEGDIADGYLKCLECAKRPAHF